MDNRTTPVEFQREALWDRLQGFLAQVGDYEFVLASSLKVKGHEIRVTREMEHGEHGLDNTIGRCLFGLACEIGAKLPNGGRLLFSSPSEWAWCSQHQFVEEPFRFFFEKAMDAKGTWHLSMATDVATGEEE